jgi:CHAT domain
MTYELQVRVANHQATATLNTDTETDINKGTANLGDDPLRLETVHLLQQWLSRWNIVSQIGSTYKKFPLLDTFRVLGEHLYEIVFAGQVGEGFTTSYQQANAAKQPLRVMLSFDEDSTELAALPWEFLYRRNDRGASFYLATATELVLNRFLPLGRRSMPIVTPPLRVLFIMCVPESEAAEQKEHMEERQEVLKSIRELKGSEAPLDVHIVEDWNRDTVDEELEKNPHVVHIIGHARQIRDNAGRMRSELELPGDDGILHWNEPEKVVELLTRGKSQEDLPKLVVLHLCEMKPVDFMASFERLAPELIEVGILAVLAMQYPMSADAARRFTSKFYNRLAAGDEIDQIVQTARYEMHSRLNDARLIGTPVLYMQSKGGRLVAEAPEIPSEGKIDPHQVSTRTIMKGGQEIRQRLKAAAWSKATSEQIQLVRGLEGWIEQIGWSGDMARNKEQIRQYMKLDAYVSERGPMYLAMLETLSDGSDGTRE